MDPEILASMKATEGSIQEWSVRHTHFQIQADGAKSTVQTLYARRQGMVQKFLKDSGLDPNRVKSVDVGEEGLVTVLVTPDDSPADGANQEASTPAS